MNIAIIDDHAMLLGGIKDLVATHPEVSTVETFNGAEGFLERFEAEGALFDLIITDIDMPGLKGSELIPIIREKSKHQRVLVLSMHKDHGLIRNLFTFGINGFVFKDNDPKELLTAIDHITQNGKYIPNEIQAILDNTEEENAELTRREIEIVQRIAKGESNKEIAANLFLSDATVKTHRKNIMFKLGLGNTADLVRYAMENKLI